MAFTLGVAIQEGQGIADTGTLTRTGMTAGRQVIIGVGWGSGTATCTVTCSGETIVQHATTLVQDAGLGVSYQFYSIASLASSGDKTFAFDTSDSSGTTHAFIQEVIGGDSAAFFNVGNTASGTGTTSSVSATTTADGCLGVAIGVNNAGVPTVGTGWTDLTTGTFDSAIWYNSAEIDLDLGTQGSKTADMTHGSAGTWKITFAAFKPAASGGVVNARNGIALSGISAINGITKTGISHINGLTI